MAYLDIEGDYFAPISPVMGESYTGILIRPPIDSISVTMPDGDVVTLDITTLDPKTRCLSQPRS